MYTHVGVPGENVHVFALSSEALQTKVLLLDNLVCGTCWLNLKQRDDGVVNVRITIKISEGYV